MTETSLDHGSFTPLYEQVRRQLMKRIGAGEWDDGRPLPPEKDLALQYGVSRITIRQALGEIARSGWVRRQRGRGTFVQPGEAYHLLGGVHNFAKNASSLERQARSKVITFEWIPAGEAAAERLNLPAGERVLHILLLRSMDDELVGWQSFHVIDRLGRQVDLKRLKEEESLNPLLPVRGSPIAEVEIMQGARLANGTDQQLLGCQPGEAVLYSQFTETDIEGSPTCTSEIAFRADRFRWLFKVVAPKGADQ